MESKKINQLATELSPELSDLTIIGDPNTGISKKITLSQMASLFTGTVEEYASLSAFPLVGAADTIYIALDTNIIYRWNTGTSAYVELSPNIVTSLVFNDANGFDGTISLVGSTATLTITTALTTGSVGFIGASGALTQDNANFFWDNSNKRLGINTNVPTTALDVFGSGIIGRVNGTSTNNAFIGFASAGTNKWSIGNVQSDNRFRIYNEATTSELVSVLQTGEFGIGIANPTTKLHIDGGASALIANLDANVSVAKSISFRSDNSARINLEVSGTESGSNAGANLSINTYSDAGALLHTPLSIVRSNGFATFSKQVTVQGTLIASNANGNIKLSGGVVDGYVGVGVSNSKLYLTDYDTATKGLIINLTNGYTGLGTDSPSTQLHIVGSNTQFVDGLRVQRQAASNQYGLFNMVGGSLNLLSVDLSGANYPEIYFQRSINGSSVSTSMMIDKDGKIGIGTVTPTANVHISGFTSGLPASSGSAQRGAFRIANSSNIAFDFGTVAAGQAWIQVSDAGNYASNFALLLNPNGGVVNIGTTSNDYARVAIKSNSTSSFAGFNVYATGNGNFVFMNHDNNIGWIGTEFASGGTGQTPLAFSVGGTERMRIQTDGDFFVGTTSNTGFTNAHRIKGPSTSQNDEILSIDGGVEYSGFFKAVSGSGYNAAACGMVIGRNTGNSRSINAGGTINASGADYAEYMLKAITDNIAKGDIVGVNAEGKLTNIFNDSISFVVKSTDPSYVGGDTWGNSDAIGKEPRKQEDQTDEEYEQLKTEYQIKLEEARAKVDRIAFSGQVPCNVLNANVGDYIIPIKQSNGKISGQAVQNPTLEQYQICVGKVWKIMEDGRAWIAVKIS